MRVAARITLSEEQRATLESWSRGRKTPARLVFRSKIVLHAAEGLKHQEIAIKLGTDRESVGRWRSRFARVGLSGIEKEAPDQEGTLRNDDARLQGQRNDHAICRDRTAQWHRNRRMYAEASPPGMDQIPARHRRADASTSGVASDRR